MKGSRIRPLRREGGLLCAPHPAHCRLLEEANWKRSRVKDIVAAGWILADPSLLRRSSCAQRVESGGKSCGSPSSPPYHAAQPAGLAGGRRLCPGTARPVAGSVGPVKCQWGPGVGDAGGRGISYGPLVPELPHRYNEPLISADLIKGLLLTGGWGAPRASSRGSAGPTKIVLWEWVDRLRRGKPEFIVVPCPKGGVVLWLVENRSAFPCKDLAVLLIKKCYISTPSGMS